MTTDKKNWQKFSSPILSKHLIWIYCPNGNKSCTPGICFMSSQTKKCSFLTFLHISSQLIKAAPTRASNLCKLFAQIAWRPGAAYPRRGIWGMCPPPLQRLRDSLFNTNELIRKFWSQQLHNYIIYTRYWSIFHFKVAEDLIAEHYERYLKWFSTSRPLKTWLQNSYEIDFGMIFHITAAENLVPEHYERDIDRILHII